MAEIVRFHVTRYNPERDAAPYVQTFEVPVREGMTVLEGLHYIKENLDASLAWRYSCRMGVCGSCGMLLNGRPTLACNTQIRHIAGADLAVAPMCARATGGQAPRTPRRQRRRRPETFSHRTLPR